MMQSLRYSISFVRSAFVSSSMPAPSCMVGGLRFGQTRETGKQDDSLRTQRFHSLLVDKAMYRKQDAHILRNIFPRAMLAALVGSLAGCTNGISESDSKFVAAGMPPQFESLRMYAAPPVSGPVGSGARTDARPQQGCDAIIRSGSETVHESVTLDSVSTESFELDIVRTSSGWSVSADGLAAPGDNPVGLRTQFTNCISAIEERYTAEPEKID